MTKTLCTLSVEHLESKFGPFIRITACHSSDVTKKIGHVDLSPQSIGLLLTTDKSVNCAWVCADKIEGDLHE